MTQTEEKFNVLVKKDGEKYSLFLSFKKWEEWVTEKIYDVKGKIKWLSHRMNKFNEEEVVLTLVDDNKTYYISQKLNRKSGRWLGTLKQMVNTNIGQPVVVSCQKWNITLMCADKPKTVEWEKDGQKKTFDTFENVSFYSDENMPQTLKEDDKVVSSSKQIDFLYWVIDSKFDKTKKEITISDIPF